MNATATQFFQYFRICSVSRPNMQTGLIQGFVGYKRSRLEQSTAEDLNFYLDDMFQQMRGPECATEEFTLQGSNSLDGSWETIKPIVPIPGNSPDEDDDGRWGVCRRCHDNLTEGENTTGDVCDGCKDAFHEEHELARDRLAEEADERRRYPEVTDDDYDQDDRYNYYSGE